MTLNGNEASDSSFGKNKSEIQDEYIRICYRNKIIQWLDRCGEIANKQPLVRETIHQYITLIKQLTNQNMEDKNKQKILDLMKSHIEASFKIAESIEDIRKIVVENLAQKLKEKLDIKEEIKISYWKNILPHIHMPYKKYWILFGCDGGGIYASIQTENEVLLLQKNSAEVLKNDLFDQYQYPFNHPFGFSRLGFSFRDDKRLINCMNENSNEFKKMEDWGIKIKKFIDDLLKNK